jgi:minor extracellular serine protease Vpr
MKRSLFILLLSMACLGSSALGAQELTTEPSEPAVGSDAAVNETPSAWFVELSNPPAADGTSLSSLKAEKDAFRSAAKKAGIKYTERYAFDVLWNGFSVNVAAGDVAKLGRIAGVKNLWPVVHVEPADDPTPDENPDLYTAIAMTGADYAQNTLGLTGAGVKVAVMDTGTDYNHPDLGGCFGPGCRVATGYDFVGDAYNSSGTGGALVPQPDNDPDDCAGHGSHVSGIIGANGVVKGVAPGVTIGAYRVFGCVGTTDADVMIAAMERALADGMQVLNMSIGSAFQWPEYPTAAASDRAVNKGMVVVASIGNSGANGAYAAGAPGLGSKVIGVASFDNTHVRLASFTISPDATPIGYTQATAAPAAPTSGSFPMARTGTATTVNDACAALPAGSLTGKVVLIRRGTCGFNVKANNAQIAGAAGVVIYNNVAGVQNITVVGPPAITIPVVAISDTQGVLINNRLAAGPVTMTWTANLGSFPNPTGNLISGFSSYGLSPDLSLKPDIAAPGGLIYSTYPLELGGYATLSGTSMASPHTAGAVALLLQARPNTPSQAVRGILQNSADPHVWSGNPGLGFLDMTHRQGAGMLDIPGAVLSTIQVDPAKLSLGESAAGPSVQTLTLRNDGASGVTFDLSHAPALATGGATNAPSFFNGPASVGFNVLGVPVSSITVPAGGSATVDVTITANPALANKSQYGGYVVFTPQGGGAVYRVPYAGFTGDYQSIQVLVPTANSFPRLGAQVAPGTFAFVPAGTTFTMANGDIPYVLAHFEHQSRIVRLEVFDAASNKQWHRALQIDYVARNSTATSFFALAFDGTTTAGNKTYTVPDGQYVIKMSVLKALGDALNPAHWETWTSPVLNIDRP